MKGRERGSETCRRVGRREKSRYGEICVCVCVDFFNYCGDAVEADYRAKVVELLRPSSFLALLLTSTTNEKRRC
jgi:hypothetical protein